MRDCHIRALGACMIGGFPHQPDDSFFHLAVEQLRKDTAHKIFSSSFTLGGFPITRILKHLDSRCLAANPDIVVIQFASSDLIVPLRRRRRKDGSIAPIQRTVPTHPPSRSDRLRWLVHGVVGECLRLMPVTPPEIYLETIRKIALTLQEHRIIPVVMSPFVFAGHRSDRFARNCADRLHQTLSAIPQTVHVDAYSALDRYPRHRMLLADGTHLSLAGHQVVADVLASCLKTLVEGRTWIRNESPKDIPGQLPQ